MSRGPLGDTNQSPFSSGTPHFFKIILEETLQENKLQIPQKFIRKYGENLSNSVFVKLPCGSKWKMELTKHENNIWLEKGWPDFAKHYSIKRGSMLVLRYEGNSEFHAVIFDTSTVEIEYPSIPVNFDKPVIDLELRSPRAVVVEDDFVEILDGLSPKKKKARKKSSLPCSQPHKKMRTSPTALEFGVIPEHRLTNTERARILERIPFESEKPFFKVLMQASYVGCKANQLTVPLDFAMRYIRKQGDVILSVPNGRSWLAEFRIICPKFMNCSARLFKGWHDFANGNNLEVGDVCIFELLDGMEISFQVSIVRFAEYESCQWSQEKVVQDELVESLHDLSPCPKAMEKPPLCSQPHKIMRMSLSAHEGGAIQVEPGEIQKNETKSSGAINDETGKSSSLDYFRAKQARGCMSTPWKRTSILESIPFESEKPFFKAVMQPSYVGSKANHLNIPLDFAMRYIKNQGDVVLSVPNGKYWSAQLKMGLQRCGYSVAKLYDGWHEFAKGCNLEVDDVCIFELLDGTDISFQVSIVRSAEYECLQCPQEEVVQDEFVESLDDSSPCPKAGEKSPLCSQPCKIMRMSPTAHEGGAVQVDPEEILENETQSGHAINNETGKSCSVAYFPAKQACGCMSTPWKKTSILERVPFESEKPFFKVLMQPSYVGSNASSLHVPLNFAMQYIRNQGDVVLSVPNGKYWSVQFKMNLHRCGKQIAKFYDGWNEFANGYNLEVDDVCIFELLDGIDISFQVSIVRSAEYECLQCSQEILTNDNLSGGAKNEGKQAMTSTERARILESIPFESEKPFFKVVMQPSYLGSKPDYLHVPLDFAMRYVKTQCEVVLSVPNGRSWLAEFRMTPRKFTNCSARLCKGWPEFAKDNNLEVGDICIFKLLHGTEISFEVSIVRFAEYKSPQWSQGNYATTASKPKRTVKG